MSEAEEIRIKLEPPEGQRAQLSDFSNVCNALRSCLKHVGRCLGCDYASFAISDLACGSAVVAVVPTNGSTDIAHTFNQTIRFLEEGRAVDSRLDFSALRAFEGFRSTIRNRDLQISVSGLRLTESYSSTLAHLLEPQSPARGSVSGRLEAVSVHGRNEFTLYMPIASEEVDCRFAPEVLRDVLDAVGHNVTVFGTLYYARTKVFPVRINVDSFQVTPSNTDLASLLDAKGILAGPPRSALESQQAMRDEWNR